MLVMHKNAFLSTGDTNVCNIVYVLLDDKLQVTNGYELINLFCLCHLKACQFLLETARKYWCSFRTYELL